MSKDLKPLFRYVGKDEEPQIIKDEEQKKKRPEDKKYIILYYMTIDSGEEEKTFDIIIGRENAYNFIKNIIEYIDIHNSIIMVDNVPYDKAITVYKFMQLMQDYFQEDSFDIEDYNIGDDVKTIYDTNILLYGKGDYNETE